MHGMTMTSGRTLTTIDLVSEYSKLIVLSFMYVPQSMCLITILLLFADIFSQEQLYLLYSAENSGVQLGSYVVRRFVVRSPYEEGPPQCVVHVGSSVDLILIYLV